MSQLKKIKSVTNLNNITILDINLADTIIISEDGFIIGVAQRNLKKIVIDLTADDSFIKKEFSGFDVAKTHGFDGLGISNWNGDVFVNRFF